MAHYAFLDENNIVIEVIPGRDEGELDIDWEEYYGQFRGLVCKRTSYNTRQGLHATGGEPFRKNYAGIGFTYDESIDGFIPSKPYPSWVLDTDKGDWKAPIDRPSQDHIWSELQTNWIIPPEKPDASTAWVWDEATDSWIEFA